MRKSFVVCDIDGTILPHEELHVSREVIDELKFFAANDMLILCTARPPKGIAYAFDSALSFVPTIALNGSALCLSSWSNVSVAHYIEPRAVKEVGLLSRTLNLSISVFSADYWWVSGDMGIFFTESLKTGLAPLVYSNQQNQILKMLIFCDDIRADILRKHLNKIDNIAYCLSNPGYFEITAKGVNKASLIPDLLEALNCKRESSVLYFAGDSYNDISIASYADETYSFKSSPDDLRKLARKVYENNETESLLSLFLEIRERINKTKNY